MEFKRFYITNSEGKTNCVIRSFCKLYELNYDDVYNELVNISKELNSESFNDIEVFEEFMKRRDTLKIEYDKDTKIKDLKLENGKYIIFCYDKKDFYHMITIIDNIIYDKSLDCLDLYTISIYKQNILEKKQKRV